MMFRRNKLPRVTMGNIQFMASIHWRFVSYECIAGIAEGDYNKILLNPKVPKYLYSEIEENAELWLLHENLHQMIYALEGWNATDAFDDLFHNDRKLKMQFCREILNP